MLIINLRSPHGIYAQGDNIAGQVIYQPPDTDLSSSPPVRMLVELAGRTKTKWQGDGSDTYRGRADLIRLPVLDAFGSQNIWPFKFFFPARASPVDPAVADMRYQTRQMKTIEPDHLLPPSFNDLMGLEIYQVFQGLVEYTVKASVWINDGGTLRLHAEQSVPIIFEPRYDPNSYPSAKEARVIVQKKWEVKSLMLLPENRDRELGFREKTFSIFHRSKLPHLSCEAKLVVPTEGYLREPTPLTVSVTPFPDSSTAPAIPDFVIKRYRIRIVGQTNALASGSVMDYEQSNEKLVHEMRRDHLNEPLLPEAKYTKCIAISPVVNTACTFTTFNIVRTYALDVEVELECADKRVLLEKKSDFVILPALGDREPDVLRGQGGKSSEDHPPAHTVLKG